MQKTMTKYFIGFLKYHKIQVPDGKTKVAQSSNMVYLQATVEWSLSFSVVHMNMSLWVLNMVWKGVWNWVCFESDLLGGGISF